MPEGGPSLDTYRVLIIYLCLYGHASRIWAATGVYNSITI